MDVPLRKATARVDLKAASAFARPQPRSRPSSPTKQSPTSSLSPPSFRPKAKVNSSATVRKLSSSGSLNTLRTNNISPPSYSRPSSPFKPSRTLSNESEPGSSPKARITARPTSRSGMAQTNSISPEQRQRALTTASAKLKLPHSEDRPRSGSVVAHHHALSTSDLATSSSPVPSQPSSTESPSTDSRRTNTSPVLAPVRVKSKVSGLVKSTSTNAGDPASRSLSPPCATTRLVHTRPRPPSITSNFALNESTPAAFYPITIASPAANPHRYVPQRALSPAHSYPSPTLSNEPHSAKKSPLAPKVDPASVPLPPHSPPISALSLSSKSSVSKTSVSLNNDQPTDSPIPGVVAHVRHRSVEWTSQPSPFFAQTDIMGETKRDRSRSRERSPQGESDAESEGPERQLRTEAKTNRKIADLEITNRSLLAINASLETTRNRQAKEIRDLRRKVRESRLILPPRTYKAVKSALEERDRDDENENENENENEDEDDSDVEEEQDETFQKVRGLIDSLIESGKRALETRPEDFRTSLAAKVLNADELRSWRDSGQRALMRNRDVDKQYADDETTLGCLSSALVAMPDNGSTSSMAGDEELASGPPVPSVLPPITITHSL